MEKEGYIVRRRKKLDEIRGQYNPAPALCDTEPYRFKEMGFAEKLINMEDEGLASIIELDDLMQGTDTVIDFSDGVYEINSSVYQNKETPADEELRRLIADAIGLDKEPAAPAAQPEEPEKQEEFIPSDRPGMAETIAALLAGTGSPYAAILAKKDGAFTDVFAPGFGSRNGSVFSFPLEGEVCTQLLSMRRTLIINSSFCELPELTGLIPAQHLKHIPSCCFAPLGPDPEGRYLFFAFDSTVITSDNVKKIIKKINNIPVLA
jgi:hypothetical protein